MTLDVFPSELAIFSFKVKVAGLAFESTQGSGIPYQSGIASKRVTLRRKTFRLLELTIGARTLGFG